MKKVKTMTASSLMFVIKDCQEALRAMPKSQKAGYYADEICYCSMELSNR
jgi:dTDP-4-amino-4,6-dideoxygalactose transaminase